MELLQQWSGLMATLIAIGTAIYSFVTARAAANSKKLENLDQRLIEQEKKVARLEQELEHLPQHDEVQEIKLEVVKLTGTVNVLAERLDALGKMTENISDMLTQVANR